MQPLYQVFYKQYGARRIQNLLAPRPLTLMSLPRDSMLHFYSGNSSEPHIDTSKMFLGINARKVIIDFPSALTSTLGNPRSHVVVLRPLFKDFLTANRKYRYLHEGYLTVDDSYTLFVENYSFIDLTYRYPTNPLQAYQKWFNAHKTIFDRVDSISAQRGKNHFFFCNVPDDLPSFSLLNVYKLRTSINMLKIFDTPDKLFILHLFKWLDAERGTIENNIFKDVKKDNLSRVNIVFNVKDGRSVVINLGLINSWIKGQEDPNETKSVSQITSIQMQKVLLKFLMSFQSDVTDIQTVETSTSVGNKTTDPQDLQEEQDIEELTHEYEAMQDMDNDDIDTHEYEDALSMVNRVQSSTNKTVPLSNLKLDNAALDRILNTEVTLDDQLKDLDNDIDTLEALTVRKLKDKGLQVQADGIVKEEVIGTVDTPLVDIQQKVYHFEDVDSSLKRQINTQADYGLLSATDYKKLVKDIEAYKDSEDPYNSGQKTIKAMIIAPEELKLSTEKITIHASELVQDKSMLESSLLALDQDYIGKILKKDMLAMTHGLQKAGVVIRNHEVEVDTSALGSYENHTLELKPIDGQVSTVRFRVPVIDEDGSFKSGNSKYFLRRQRVDIPIRKIRPTEVALTSYYGKTFVRVNSKKANSSLEWLYKELNIASMTEHTYIKRVNPARVFDNDFTAPYIYNALADNYKSIITTKYTLVFDHNEREKLADAALLSRLEVNGSRVAGFTAGKQLITVDKDNIFSIVDKNVITPVGDIFTMLELDPHKAPVDFTEVNIFSKALPVAFVLGYTLGFKNLIKLLQVKYRVIEGRQQKNLHSHEYAISFRDYSYIFSRKDRVASLILAGFNEFEKQLRMYEVEDFNHKDVYLNLMETKGLSAIYMRELNLIEQLFVDPITKEILEQMKEPVTFNGLLIRSTEMMLSYEHPDSQDMQAMRIRGYERLPGAVYKEMVGAIRQYRNKNIAGKSKIDISPYQIWSTIMKDPAIKLVEDINPIQNLKESEIVTYVGEGGRSKDAMNKASRAYHQNDMGIISEATVDSSDVGVNAYLSANPRFKDLRGLPIIDNEPIVPSSLVSTSALLAIASDKDDPKRVEISMKCIHYMSIT